MEQSAQTKKLTATVDRQAMSLLDITFWSNIVVTGVIVAINAVNLLRTDGKSLISAASPEIVLLASALLCIWMAARAVSAVVTKNRLKEVSVSLGETGVEGVSLKDPMRERRGEYFSIAYADITQVLIVNVAITKKHTVPSLKIDGRDVSYVIPAPENLQLIQNEILGKL